MKARQMEKDENIDAMIERVHGAVVRLADMFGHLDDERFEGPHDKRLQCHVTAYVPVDSKTLAIVTPALNCTDYEGAIDVATHILPLVDLIVVASAAGRFYAYYKADGEFKFYNFTDD